MIKKVTLASLAIGLIAPTFALAQTTDVSAQIAALVAEIQQLEQQIAQLKGGSTTTCVNLPSDLTLGATGSDVTNLQNYLIAKGDLDAQYNTGYYGFLTAGAVGKLQLSFGLVSSANDAAYGITGPQTRAAIACPANSSPQSNFTASPATGNAPLTVQFGGLPSGASDEELDFGDGANVSTNATGVWPGNGIASHTYTSPGTYTATLYRSMPHVALGTAVISVSGQISHAPSATLDQSSLMTGSATPTITGTASNTGSNFGISIGKGDKEFGSGNIPVVNGRWSVTVSPALSAGSHEVDVYNDNVLITSGMLTVASPQSIGLLTCSVVANPASIQSGQSTTLTWKSTNATSGQWIQDPSGKEDALVPSPQSLASSGSITFTPEAATTGTSYVPGVFLKVFGANGASATCSAYITVNSSESASFDDTVFTQGSTPTPTIAGKASGVGQVDVTLSANGSKAYDSGLVSVVNGRWSVTVSPALPTGQYMVYVNDSRGNGLVNGGYLNVTATAIDPSIQDLILRMSNSQVTPNLCNDLNGNGIVTSADALLYAQGHALTSACIASDRQAVATLILQMAVGSIPSNRCYDLNGDGKITSTDSLLYQQGQGPTSACLSGQ
jgi:PKD repeat protein